MLKQLVLFSFLIPLAVAVRAQKDSPVYFKGATKENRNKLHRDIIKYSISGNLSLALNDDTEENWIDAFGGIGLLHYKSPWTDNRISLAFDSIEKRSTEFQRALLELAYSSYPGRFVKQVKSLLKSTNDAKVFAMSAEYLVLQNALPFDKINLENKIHELVKNDKDEAIITQLNLRIYHRAVQQNCLYVTGIVNSNFLKSHTVLFSFQRRNRNFPGLAMIRDSLGNFVKAENGQPFSVPQLARSISNLPGYLTDGNTPQGIFRMYGLDTSKSSFIGPTANIQLTMPFETSISHFLNDSTITDTVWTEEWYKKLLPAALKNCRPMYESFYAGKAGRTEIIAHGTTVDPEFYAGEIYYPQTPTIGCLCTKETWSDINGKRLESDQQKLVNALQAAGGAKGYCVVIEIDDSQKPVEVNEILSFLKL